MYLYQGVVTIPYPRVLVPFILIYYINTEMVSFSLTISLKCKHFQDKSAFNCFATTMSFEQPSPWMKSALSNTSLEVLLSNYNN